MSEIIPINDHVLIKPVVQETSFSSSQATYEERGEVLAIYDLQDEYTSSEILHKEAHKRNQFKVGSFVYFDSWRAAKYKDGEGNEHWVVPVEAIRAVEK